MNAVWKVRSRGTLSVIVTGVMNVCLARTDGGVRSGLYNFPIVSGFGVQADF